jgi:hypothetical protein
VHLNRAAAVPDFRAELTYDKEALPSPLGDDMSFEPHIHVEIDSKTVLDEPVLGPGVQVTNIDGPELFESGEGHRLAVRVRVFLRRPCEDRTITYLFAPTDEDRDAAGELFLHPLDVVTHTTIAQAKRHDITATLSYAASDDSRFLASGVRLRVERGRTVAIDEPILPDETLLFVEGPMIGDLSSEGLDVLVHAGIAGAYCCSASVIAPAEKGGAYGKPVRHDWGNYRDMPQMKDLDGDSLLEFVTRDEPFSGELGPYVITGAEPVQVWQLRDGHLTNVTRRFPELIEHDAQSWWNAYASTGKDFSGSGVALAAYLADMHMLGKGAEGLSRAKERPPRDAEDATGNRISTSAYFRWVTRLLAKHGY